MDDPKIQALIDQIAKKFLPRGRMVGLTYDDLVQEGYVGLQKARRRFDLSRGASLATYARSFIEGEIREAVRGSLPKNKVRHPSIVRRAEADLLADGFANPSDAQLAQRAGLMVPDVHLARRAQLIDLAPGGTPGGEDGSWALDSIPSPDDVELAALSAIGEANLRSWMMAVLTSVEYAIVCLKIDALRAASIAEILLMTEGAVNENYHRARQRLLSKVPDRSRAALEQILPPSHGYGDLLDTRHHRQSQVWSRTQWDSGTGKYRGTMLVDTVTLDAPRGEFTSAHDDGKGYLTGKANHIQDTWGNPLAIVWDGQWLRVAGDPGDRPDGRFALVLFVPGLRPDIPVRFHGRWTYGNSDPRQESRSYLWEGTTGLSAPVQSRPGRQGQNS
jgi:RNA polymerase sigma factor (sigma-70 family)